MNILSRSPEETFELGKKIGSRLERGMLLALEGDLGGGKTTFTKGLAKGLGVKEDITSPSFTLEKVYQVTVNRKPASTDSGRQLTEKRETPKANSEQQIAKFYHFDFYRVDNPLDMISFELKEALEDPEGIVVIEWAEKIETELPKEKLVVKFHYKGKNERFLEFIATGGRYQLLIKNENLKM